MKTYLSEISRVALLSRDEEHALAVKVRDQVPGARESMVRANLRLVVAIGRSFRGRGFS
ncbi:MAG: sigma-70 factor domain-containing protein, partial [Planctomycetota bacterium]